MRRGDDYKQRLRGREVPTDRTFADELWADIEPKLPPVAARRLWRRLWSVIGALLVLGLVWWMGLDASPEPNVPGPNAPAANRLAPERTERGRTDVAVTAPNPQHGTAARETARPSDPNRLVEGVFAEEENRVAKIAPESAGRRRWWSEPDTASARSKKPEATGGAETLPQPGALDPPETVMLLPVGASTVDRPEHSVGASPKFTRLDPPGLQPFPLSDLSLGAVRVVPTSPRIRWQLALTGGVQHFGYRYETDESDPLGQERQRAETSRPGISVGLSLRARLRGLRFAAGLEQQQLRTDFNYQQTYDATVRRSMVRVLLQTDSSGNRVPLEITRQDTLLSVSRSRMLSNPNRYTLLTLPLTVGYGRTFGRFDLSVHAGVALRLAARRRAWLLRTDGTVRTLPKGEAGLLPLRPELHLGVRAAHSLRGRWRALGQIQLSGTPFAESDVAGLRVQSGRIAVRLGVGYQL